MSSFKKVINCLALDPSEAKIREDAFFCKKINSGWELVVVVVIPPIQLMKDENLDDCLNHLFKSSRNLPILFPRHIRMEHSLKEDKLRPVLATEYFVSNEGQVKQEIVSPKSARAIWIDHGNHDEKDLCNNAHKAVKMIHKNHETGDILNKKARRWQEHNVSFDQHLSNLLLDLFSFTCRATCKNAGIPYYHPRIPSSILVSDSNYGRFHRPMRDVLALINLLNLHNHLINKKDCLINEEDLFKTLGSTHKLLMMQ